MTSKKDRSKKDNKISDLNNQIHYLQNGIIDLNKENYPEIDIKIWRRLYNETIYMAGMMHAVLFTYDISAKE